jgi:hypothetical protein
VTFTGVLQTIILALMFVLLFGTCAAFFTKDDKE